MFGPRHAGTFIPCLPAVNHRPLGHHGHQSRLAKAKMMTRIPRRRGRRKNRRRQPSDALSSS